MENLPRLEPFNINRCFVCHKSALEITLKRCGACKRISYCSEAHQKQDWDNHKKFCKVLKKVEKNVPELTFENKNMWTKYQNSLVGECEKELKRYVRVHEAEMIFYPKKCRFCGAGNANIFCENCLAVNYCTEEHKKKDSKSHAENCNDLKKALDAPNFFYKKYELCWSLLPQKGILKLTENMEDFIRTNIKISNIKPDEIPKAKDQISVDLSYAASLLHGLNLLNFKVKDKLVIHMVGCTFSETLDLRKWEIALHIHPQIKHFMIFFIGPAVVSPIRLNFCASCQKIFQFKCVNALYHDFVKSVDYQKPDIVCIFLPGFYAGFGEPYGYEKYYPNPWLETLPLLFKNAPLIMTSHSEHEAEQDTETLSNINKNLVIKTSKNPFASFIPMRNMQTPGVFCTNYYISVIYKDPSAN